MRISIDGRQVRTAVPASSGRVSILLDPDECVGTRRISIQEVNADDTAGRLLVGKMIEFRRV